MVKAPVPRLIGSLKVTLTDPTVERWALPLATCVLTIVGAVAIDDPWKVMLSRRQLPLLPL